MEQSRSIKYSWFGLEAIIS